MRQVSRCMYLSIEIQQVNENSGCRSGEIDIMEHINNGSKFYGTLHFGKMNGDSCQSSGGECNRVCCDQAIAKKCPLFLSGNADVGQAAAAWHVYAVKWSPSYIAFLLDGQEYYRSAFSEWIARLHSLRPSPQGPQQRLVQRVWHW